MTETAADGSCLHLSSGSWWPELPSSHLAITCQPRRPLRLTPPPGRVREHPAALLRGRHLSIDNQFAGIFISAPHDGQIYVAERSLRVPSTCRTDAGWKRIRALAATWTMLAM